MKLYNSEYKEAFLSALDNTEESKYQYVSSFNSIAPIEDEIGKDLYDMNMDELEEVFYKLKRKSSRSAISIFNLIKSYITWAKANGYSATRLHPIVETINNEYVDKYLYKARKNFYTREEIIEGFKNLLNYRDMALVLCLFEGLSGKHLSEILNLRREDVVERDGQYYVNVLTDEVNLTTRTLSISKELYDLLILTYEQQETKNTNGGKSRVADGAYVFRKNRIGADGDVRLKNATITAKYMYLIKDAYEDDNIDATTINNSGLMYYVNEAMGNTRVLNKEVVDKVAQRFDLTLIAHNGKVYTSYGRFRERIDIDYMRETYGDFKYELQRTE